MAYWPPFFRPPRNERWLVQSVDDWWTRQGGSLVSKIYTRRVVPTWQEPWTSGDPSLASGSPWTCPSSFSRAPCPWSGQGESSYVCVILFWNICFEFKDSICSFVQWPPCSRSAGRTPQTRSSSLRPLSLCSPTWLWSLWPGWETDTIVTRVRNRHHRDHGEKRIPSWPWRETDTIVTMVRNRYHRDHGEKQIPSWPWRETDTIVTMARNRYHRDHGEKQIPPWPGWETDTIVTRVRNGYHRDQGEKQIPSWPGWETDTIVTRVRNRYHRDHGKKQIPSWPWSETDTIVTMIRHRWEYWWTWHRWAFGWALYWSSAGSFYRSSVNIQFLILIAIKIPYHIYVTYGLQMLWALMNLIFLVGHLHEWEFLSRLHDPNIPLVQLPVREI